MNSRAKYEELQLGTESQSQSQRSINIILDIIRAFNEIDSIQILIDKAMTISKSNSNLSPVVVFQVAADEAKVDELCN